ncbi:AraC family transcriptional regulator [Pseudonocardia sp. GCM10023141]|uniref:AraC family transcriptional regulator n=1 Tax=Pseudonocardia sp. GCM10023141 TaxID=3252653 RepID=UPI0036201D8D
MPSTRHFPPTPTGRHVLAPGTVVERHHHDEHQIVYAGRGVLSVTTDAGSWVAPPNRAIWIPAGTPHQHHAHGATDLLTVGLPVGANPLGLLAPAVLGVDPLLRELIRARTSEPDAGPAEQRRLLGVLLDRLRQSPQQPVHLPAALDPRLVAVCALLHADPADGRTLPQLGTAVGASARTLARLCRHDLGMTFPQWRTQLRLQHALRLLASGAPVTLVAHRCGWASTSAFIDVFRRAFGHTPGTHR